MATEPPLPPTILSLTYTPAERRQRIEQAFASLQERGVSLFIGRDGLAMQANGPLPTSVVADIAKNEAATIEDAVRSYSEAEEFVSLLDELGYDVQIGSGPHREGRAMYLLPVDRRTSRPNVKPLALPL